MKVLIQFFDEWEDFRLSELLGILKLLDIAYSPSEPTFVENCRSRLFSIVDVPDEASVRALCTRSVLIKAVYEVWGMGTSLDEAVEATKAAYSSNSWGAEKGREDGAWGIDRSLFGVENSWCVDIQLLYKKVPSAEKDAYRNRFKFLDFLGPVKLRDPEVNVTVVLDYFDEYATKAKDSNSNAAEANTKTPLVYCGRVLAKGGMREELRKYDLKKRLYLGPTTLDHGLAFLMANMAGVKPGHVCLDPFVGTASLLIALAHHGAFCMGTDIDVRVIRGMMYAGSSRQTDSDSVSKQDGTEEIRRDIFTTFRDYSLPPPELTRLDLHSFMKHYHHSAFGTFDSIVTDPPYGIRAGGRKSGRAEKVDYEVSAERRADHIPSTQSYAVEEVMLDLLECSAMLLKVDGTLCYLIPTPYDFSPSDLPAHPCFELEHLCLQTLSTRHGRHAVMLRKKREYTSQLKEEFLAYKERVLTGEEGHFDQLARKLEAALAPGSRGNEAVVIRSSKKFDRRHNAKLKRKEHSKSATTVLEMGGALKEL